MKEQTLLIFAWVAIVFIALPLIRLVFETTTFIPNSATDAYGILSCLCVGVLIQALSTKYQNSLSTLEKVRIEYKSRLAGMKPTSPFIKKTLPLFTIIFVTLVLYSGVFLYAGQYYTEYAGATFEDSVLIPKKAISRSKICGYEYKISSPQFTGAFGLRFVCIDEITQKKLPDKMGAVDVSGKISGWGRNIENYTYIDDPDVITRLYNEREQLIEKWKN